MEITMQITLDDFNEPLEFEEPTDALDLEDFLSQVFGGESGLIEKILSGNILDGARANSRDARRISDIKQIQTALELYYNDSNSYPLVENSVVLGQGDYTHLCLEEGFAPMDFNCTTTIYMSQIPANPEPGGSDYIYQSIDGKEYTIKFTIETDTGGFKAGNVIATPSGIQNITNLDSDNDGLTNEDEINIWFTELNNPDTDGDGYLDGEEVNNGYNPLGPGKLE